MFQTFLSKLWGSFESKQECLKFIRLAIIFAFTIGVYWIINPTKDIVFLHTIGLHYYAYAKIFSLLTMGLILPLYGRLTDYFYRHQIFYVLCGISSCICFGFSFSMYGPLASQAGSIEPYVWYLGWLWYAFVEIFGSLIVTLFWTFAADISTPESAKKGFSLIAFGAQIGGVAGPLLFYKSAKTWNPALFAFIGGVGIVCIAGLMYYFMRVTPHNELAGFDHKKETVETPQQAKTGFFEGLRLIASQKYLLGVVTIVMLYEVVATVMEFHVKTMARLAYGDLHDLSGFFFKYALYANGIALLSLLLGIGAIGRSLGLLKTLLFLPILMGIGIGVVYLYPNLWVGLFVFVLIKGLNYALNQPAKEQLYIPTSKDSKYKAKAWIDTFGSRSAKGAGSAVHMLRPVVQSVFMGVSSLLCWGLIGVWIAAALFVGKAHAQAVKEDKLVC